MSHFTDNLRAGIKHIHALHDDANKMYTHAAVCIHEACDVHKGLSWTRQGRKITLWAKVKDERVFLRSCWCPYTRRKVLTAYPNDVRPGHVQLILYGTGKRGTDGGDCDNLVNCESVGDINDRICQGICHFMARNTLVSS
jgi:hypothetical protein